jgi:NADPH:quinone reductase-like Zn-dependent oxidoreductase
MKAVVLHEYGPASQLRFEDVEDPKPAAGEVLVRVSATSINPVDWMLRSGAVKDLIPIEFPYILGIDLAGVLCEVGERVTDFEPGDHVMALAAHTYAELCTVKATDLVKIPDGLEMATAATLPLVNVTGDQLVRLGARVESGQTLVITGALGAVGRSAVFAASEIGARIIAGVRGSKLNAARELHGVVEAVAIDDDTEIDKLGMVDCVADTIGGRIALKLLNKVKQGGSFGCFPSTPQDGALHPGIQINSIYAKVDTATTLHYAEAVRDGRLTIPIDRIAPLARAGEAQAAAEKGGVAKIVLTP